MDTIIALTLAGMRIDGRPYQGFLYAGVMIDNAGLARALEFNCRMGDPETQSIMMRLKTDIVATCSKAAARKSRSNSIRARQSVWCWRRVVIPITTPAARSSAGLMPMMLDN